MQLNAIVCAVNKLMESKLGKKIVFFCDWLPPDLGAVGQYAIVFVRGLAEQGNDVYLFGFTSSTSGIESKDTGYGRLTISYINRPIYDRSAFLKRAFWTLTSNLILIKSALAILKQCDEIRFTGSPPYMLHFVMPIALIFRKKTRYRITDFHPEVLVASLGRFPWWLRFVSALTNFWRRRVDIIEVLGEDQRRAIIRESRVDPRIIELVRDPSPVKFTKDIVASDIPESIQGRAVILYSGNWGVAHDVKTFIEGFSQFCKINPSSVALWLNATGKNADLVANLLEEKNLPFVRTKLAPLDQLAGILLSADIHLITLNNAFVAYALPSKVYACIESGRPILFIGSKESDVHLVCVEHMPINKYRQVDVDDATGVTSAINDLLLA